MAEQPIKKTDQTKTPDRTVESGPMRGKTEAEIAAMPNKDVRMSNRDAGLSHLTNNLVPQEGAYNTIPGLPEPPKFVGDEYDRMDHSRETPNELGRYSDVPENRTSVEHAPDLP